MANPYPEILTRTYGDTSSVRSSMREHVGIPRNLGIPRKKNSYEFLGIPRKSGAAQRMAELRILGIPRIPRILGIPRNS